MAALAILTSVTGINAAVVEETQQIANAEKNVTQVKDTNIFPYNGVVSFKDATGFVIGKIQLSPINMYQKIIKLAIELLPIQTVTKEMVVYIKLKAFLIIRVMRDISVMNIEEQAVERGPKGFNFNENVQAFNFAKDAKVDDKIKVIGYPLPAHNSFKQFESTGTIKRIKDNILNF